MVEVVTGWEGGSMGSWGLGDSRFSAVTVGCTCAAAAMICCWYAGSTIIICAKK